MWFWKLWDLRTNFLWNLVSLDLILYKAHRKMQDLLKSWLFPSTMSVWLCILYKDKFFYFHLKWKTIKFHEAKLWKSKPSFSPSGMWKMWIYLKINSMFLSEVFPFTLAEKYYIKKHQFATISLPLSLMLLQKF